jgi:hypothetical protein
MSSRTSTDPPRAFCGFGTTFESPGDWSADAFRRWVGLRFGLPVQLSRDVVISSAGVFREIGWVTDSALVDESSIHPGGLLVLGHLHAGVVGDRVLEDVRNPHPRRPRWGLVPGREGGTVTLALPEEVSVTLRAAHRRALILGVGDRAREAWDVLVISQPAGPAR